MKRAILAKQARKDLLAMWEEIKMLDILEIAQEKGFEQGIEQGISRGKTLGMLESLQEIIVEALFERFKHIPGHILQQIRAIQSHDILKIIFRQIFRCNDIQDFEKTLSQIMT